jgi:hypothetical protein
VSSGKIHNPVEPLPEGEISVGQGLATELRPGDHQRLEVVGAQVRVPVGRKASPGLVRLRLSLMAI